MATFEDLQDEYEAACLEEDRAVREGRLTHAIMLRRDAAIRSLHAAEDPWMPCMCLICEAPSD